MSPTRMFLSPGRRAAFLLLVLAVGALVSACTDEKESAPRRGAALSEIRTATYAGETARVTGTITSPSGEQQGLEGESGAEPARGRVTTTRLEEGQVALEYLWVDDSLYLKGGDSPGGTAPPGGDQLWGRVSLAGYGRVLISPYDPFSLLALLQDAGATATAEGTESFDGRELERFTVETGPASIAVGAAGRVELFTDDQRRLVHVRTQGPQTIEYEVSDYGVEVEPTAPSPDQVSQGGQTESGESPTGPYEQLVQGMVDGRTWQLVRAPATNEGTCWRMDASDGGIDPVAATREDGATCIPGLAPDAPIDEQVQIVADAGAAAPFDALVATAPPGSVAQLQLLDGTIRDVPVDPNGFLVWVGPKSPLAVTLTVTATDGTRAVCGPGPVSSLDDVESLPPDQVEQLDRFPWLCVPDG